MKKITFFLLATLAMMAFSCNEDDNAAAENPTQPTTDSEFAKNFGNPVQRDFIGQVIDADNEGISGVTVKIGNSSVQTDANGVFIIKDANVYERFAYITASKPGFIGGSRALVPTSGKNNIRIMLIPAETTQVISSGASSTVDLPNGTKVVFDGAFADENGNAYSGSVNVSMFHLESSNENIASLMPGMLYAKSESGQPVGLETFGMLHVELRGSGGQKLQIASGHTAAMTMKIDPSQASTAPATIPLWHFDEVNGYWKQQGSATKQGNLYVGNVSHFSWWNCDAPFPTNSLTVIITDTNGLPLKNVGIGIVRPNAAGSPVGYTDDMGHISGMVPANEPISLQIYNPCGDIVKTVAVSPINSPTQIDVALGSTEITSSSVKGKLVKCDGSNVGNGYVILEFGSQMLFAEVTNGDFQFAAARCNGTSDFVVRGYDLDNFQSTGSLGNRFGSTTTDLGIIPVCNGISEYIVYQFKQNGVLYPPRYIFDGITAKPDPLNPNFDLAIIGKSLNSPQYYIFLGFNTTVPGFYSNNEIDLLALHTTGVDSSSWLHFFTEGASLATFNLSKFGGVGQYIDISFHGSGTTGAASTPIEVSGYAHVLRDE